jgi:FAD/FMN-containing dehydrogenase
MRDEHFTMLAYAAWEPNQSGSVPRKWAHDLSFNLRPFSLAGGYANLPGPDASEQVGGAYGANAARLRASKAELDPNNVFSSALMLPM